MAIRSPKWLVLTALVAAAPDTPGVFELWDDDELLYVGATRDSLRKELVHELLEHESRATHFSWEITFDPAARERELLAEYTLEHQHRPRLNSN
jgi:excinuclease UvrABC nuclease subunit